MKKFKCLSLSLLSIASFCFTSCGKYKPVEVYKFIYSDMDENVMPISGWVAPSARAGLNTLEQYKILKESGLNSIYGLYESFGTTSNVVIDSKNVTINNSDEVYKALDYASQVGVKYFVRDPYLWNKDGEDFKKEFEARGYTSYSGFGGFMYTDEPKTQEQFDSIKLSYDKFRKYVPDKYAFYVNLNPMEIFTYNNGTVSDYIDYLDAYTSTVKPRFLSYDYYCPYGEFPSIKKPYFKQLYAFSNFASENKLPFWAFALASGHEFSSGGYYRGPTEVDIYFQVNTILAYGAKAVQYFCYSTPLGETETSTEHYIGKGGSVVNEKGEKTEIFPYIQKMNNYVAFVDHLLMNSTKIGIMAHEEYPAAYLVEETTESIRDVESLCSEDNIIVSVFDYNGKTLYYCVNTSLLEDSTFTLNFNKKMKFNSYSMDLEKKTQKSKSFSYTLEPGKGIILETL